MDIKPRKQPGEETCETILQSAKKYFIEKPRKNILKKIRERLFKKIHEEYLIENLLRKKIDKGIKAFIAFALDNSSVRKKPRQLIFYIIFIIIFERKFSKKYSNENPRKNIRKKIRGRMFERKSTKNV